MLDEALFGFNSIDEWSYSEKCIAHDLGTLKETEMEILSNVFLGFSEDVREMIKEEFISAILKTWV